MEKIPTDTTGNRSRDRPTGSAVPKPHILPQAPIINIITQKFLERLRNRVIRVHTNIVKNWILHHDNAPANVAQFLTFKCTTVMLRPPYSPDLTPGNFFLFEKVKSAVKGYHFEEQNIRRAVTQALNDFPQASYQECYKQWQHCW